MKKINQTWYGVLDGSRNKLLRITTSVTKASSTSSVTEGATVQMCQAKTAKQAIKTICADVVARATAGCFNDHNIAHDY